MVELLPQPEYWRYGCRRRSHAAQVTLLYAPLIEPRPLSCDILHFVLNGRVVRSNEPVIIVA